MGLATALAWLVAPTSASGPEGMPRGFESGLRYLAPALVLGLALLPTAPLIRHRLTFVAHKATNDGGAVTEVSRRWRLGGLAALVGLAAIVGYAYQRHYLQERYEHVSFAAPGLNQAFDRASDLSDVRIATTSTRQYPLFGGDLSNHVQFVGEERPHGGFEAPTTCRRWRQLLNAGGYDYVIASWDRIEPGQPPYPPQAAWTAGANATVVEKTPPTVVFELDGPLDPAGCRVPLG